MPVSKGAPGGAKSIYKIFDASTLSSELSPRTEEGNVIFHVALGRETLRIRQAAKGRDPGENRVCLIPRF